ASGRPVSDPQWISDFLRQKTAAVDRQFESVRARFDVRRGVGGLGGNPERATRMTHGLLYALSFAEQLAERTTHTKVIRGRHLLAALIVDPPDGDRLGAAQCLEEGGVDVPLLREQLWEWVRGYTDEDAE